MAQKTFEPNLRNLCADSLSNLGEEKLFVLNNSIASFIVSFERVKNLELVDSLGLDELRRLHIDKESMAELKEMQQFATAVAGGITAGAAGGALTACGAYNAAMAFGAASTGTAISSLSGITASNATIAFFGGGSLAAGEAGMAGGAVVLGGLVAGLALLVMGLITGKKTDEKLDIAKAKSTVLRAATMAGSVKSILDTPILTEEGNLTDESQQLIQSFGVSLEK